MGIHWFKISALIVFIGTFVESFNILHPQAPQNKPGQCPRFLTRLPTSLGCSEDSDCPENDKCCTYHYGPVCMHPVFVKSECPKPTHVGSCEEECSEDSNCCNGLKCCFNGCGHECKVPVIVKPGYCGLWAVHECGDFCRDDGYCPGEQKCCHSYCGHFCKDPI